MKNLLGHIGAWAPRAEQVALAGFLNDAAAVRQFQHEMNGRVQERLDALHRGLTTLKDDGYPVDCISPQGAIYFSMRLDLIGRKAEGKTLASNEAIRQLLLDRAGLAVVPFQAFGLDSETGWFRLSVGAVSVEEIEQAFPRLRKLLDDVK